MIGIRLEYDSSLILYIMVMILLYKEPHLQKDITLTEKFGLRICAKQWNLVE